MTRDASGRSYPSSYDLRALGRVSPVEDQGQHRTCWAFAALGSLESCLLPGDAEEFSEDNLALTSGFDGSEYGVGTINEASAYLARWAGPVLASQDAYGDGKTPPGLTPAYHVQDIAFLPPRANQHDNGPIKAAVMKYGAVTVSMHSPDETRDGWDWLLQHLRLGGTWNASDNAYYYNGSKGADHDVDIVGWDDNYSRKNFGTKPPGNGAFIVRNSWGTGWGDNGYFYVSYYDKRLARTAWSAVFDGAQPTDNFDAIYQYDPLGLTDGYGYSSDTAWCANVFRAKSSDVLSAVSFWAQTPSTKYKVYAATGSTWKLSAEGSGTFSLAGYHTVYLKAPINLSAGQRFRVAVHLTTPGGKSPIPLETRVKNWTSAAAAGRGQSFVSRDGHTWTDLTTLKGQRQSNVCLKAFTRPEIACVTSPGTGSPPATLGSYPMQPFGTDPTEDYSDVDSVDGPTGTISFDTTLAHYLVGSGWATWSNGYTGDVYADSTVLDDGSLETTITLPPRTGAFYLYAEPNIFDDFSMSATAQDGTTSGELTVQGDSGAQYFGFYSNGGTPISSVQVTDSGGDSEMAMGEFGIAPLSAMGTAAPRAVAGPPSAPQVLSIQPGTNDRTANNAH